MTWDAWSFGNWSSDWIFGIVGKPFNGVVVRGDVVCEHGAWLILGAWLLWWGGLEDCISGIHWRKWFSSGWFHCDVSRWGIYPGGYTQLRGATSTGWDDGDCDGLDGLDMLSDGSWCCCWYDGDRGGGSKK